MQSPENYSSWNNVQSALVVCGLCHSKGEEGQLHFVDLPSFINCITHERVTREKRKKGCNSALNRLDVIKPKRPPPSPLPYDCVSSPLLIRNHIRKYAASER